MSEEVKDVVAEEAAVEATEEVVEESGKKGKAKKEKKAKKEIDFNAYLDKAKDVAGKGSEKMTSVVQEADNKKRFFIFAILLALEVVLSGLAGTNFLMLIVQALVAVVGLIGLKAAFPDEKEDSEETTEE